MIETNVVHVAHLATGAGNVHNTAVGKNQYAQFTIATFGGASNQYANVLLRYNGQTQSGYDCSFNRTAGATYASIFRRTGGADTLLLAVATPIIAGDTAQGYVSDNLLVARVNNVPVASVADPANLYPSGLVGLEGYITSGTISDFTIDSFSAGNMISPERGGWVETTDDSVN